MKKVIVTAVLVIASLSPAMASHYEITFHDTLRPGSHQRSLAVAKAASAACYAQTGTLSEDAPTQALKDCMNAQGFRWMSTELVRDAAPKRAASAIPKGHYIDPDHGLICHNEGIASICESPPDNMTIHYTSPSGLNCTRTGAMSICSNL
jgi:hypothetical protein